MQSWKITNETIDLIKSQKYPAHKISEITGFCTDTIRKNARKLNVQLPKGHIARNLAGKKLDHLLVLERIWIEGNKNINWKCLCDCGKECIKTTKFLCSIHYKSCGCSSWIKHKNKANVKGHPSARVEWHNIRSGALRRGYIFELKFDEYLEIAKKTCVYCGSKGREIKRGNAAYPFIGNGVDRKDNTKGYTLDNSVPCCNICNRAKGNLSLENFLNWIKGLQKYGKKANKIL